MSLCPVCKKESDELLCPYCGFVKTEDFINYRTVAVVNPKTLAEFNAALSEANAPEPVKKEKGKGGKKVFIIAAAVAVAAIGGFAAIKAVNSGNAGGNYEEPFDEATVGQVEEYESVYEAESPGGDVESREDKQEESGTYATSAAATAVTPTASPITTAAKPTTTTPTTTKPTTSKPTTAKPTTTKNEPKELSLSETVELYNSAVRATGSSASGYQTMSLAGEITGDGSIGTVLKILNPVIESTLEKNSTSINRIPGYETDLLTSDVTSATATSKNGVTTINIQLKNQWDGPNGDAHYGGSVARGIGTLGSFDDMLYELGAEIHSGKDTVSMQYSNAYIRCTVNESTGKITGGTWHYRANISIGRAEIAIGSFKFTVANFSAPIDYTATV